MSFQPKLKKVKTIYNSLSQKQQGELLRIVTNENIVMGLKHIDDIKSLTGFSMYDHEITTNSTPVSKKHKLIKHMFENNKTSGDQIEQSGLSITSLTVAFETMLKYLRRDKIVVDKYPEFFV